jgi:hypothetical protein
MKPFTLFLLMLMDKSLFPSRNRGALRINGTPAYQPKSKPAHGRGKKGRGW